MNTLSDRVSYIKGLVEGLNMDTEKPEGRVMSKVLELLEAMADEITDLTEQVNELNDYVDSIDEDLAAVEEDIYGDEEDDDEDYEDEDDEDEGDNIVQYACPYCGEEMTFEVDNFDFDEDYLCPSCHKPLFPQGNEEEDGGEEV